jgi:hypothetical protein
MYAYTLYYGCHVKIVVLLKNSTPKPPVRRFITSRADRGLAEEPYRRVQILIRTIVPGRQEKTGAITICLCRQSPNRPD